MTGTATPHPRRGAGLIRSTMIVAGIRGIDFGLSFLVSVLLAARFGAGGQLDAFFLARRTTVGFADTIRKLVAQVVMPAVVHRIDAGQPLSIHGLPRRIYGFVGLLVLVTLVGTLIPSTLVGLFAPGFTGERHTLTAHMMAIMMPLLPIAVVGSMLMAVLQANRRYLLSEGTNIVQRGLLVLVLAFAIPPLGIVAGAWTMLGAGILGTAILFAGAWGIVRRRPASLLGAREAAGAEPPARTIVGGGVAAAVVLQIYFQATALLDFAIASMVPSGGVAALEYGSRLVTLIPGLVMSSLYTVLQPELIRAMQNPDRAEAALGLARFQRIALFAQAPVSVGMMLGAPLIVAILFGRGAFDAASIALAAGTTAGYAAAAIFLAPFSAITAAIYADPYRPCLRDIAIIAIGGVLLRAAMVAAAAPVWGAPGIAYAAAASTLGVLMLAQVVAVRRFPDFAVGAQGRDIARIAACAGTAALAGYALVRLLPDPAGTPARSAMLGLIGGVVLGVYVIAAIALRVPELARARAILAGVVGRKLGRKRA